MLTLPAEPAIDKLALIGACVRLPLAVDAPRLEAELAGLPAQLWGGRGGRIGVHSAAEAVFLRGHAPAEGDLPIEDRPPLQWLPYIREIIGALIPAQPMRCLLAKLPAGAVIATHIDRADYFNKTLRLHIPIVTNERMLMYCGGRVYRMRSSEIWALNNSNRHGVWNAHPEQARTHLICDFLPSAPLLELIRQGESDLGQVDAVVERRLARPAHP
ncbi:aspartyl/asparaginyl beta-hydroxylase domain-containing protein [Nevskia soli]|uniref:aspartyl/asparaginyl beta-hydroxylase domain-containing protein n=1 Tax=Nevskia soli TaxID=418856 RepID=UPI0004A70D32|nr:aspartyl/asparaginyl beta-hydroxylase domain-containing protein [Nevskia soli]